MPLLMGIHRRIARKTVLRLMLREVVFGVVSTLGTVPVIHVPFHFIQTRRVK